MAQGAATAFANQAFGIVLSKIDEKIKLWKAVRDDCQELQLDLNRLVACMDDELAIWRDASRTATARQNSEQVRNLTHDMEDCIERFLHPVTCQDGASWLRRAAHTVTTLPTRDEFAKKMKKLNKRLQKAGDRMKISLCGDGQSANSNAVPAGRGRNPYTLSPVGIAKAKEELRTLLDGVEGELPKLRVISIVGFGGSGKTTLVRAVYRDYRVGRGQPFSLLAWVDRSDYEDAGGLLRKIIKEFWGDKGESDTQQSDAWGLRDYISNKLETHRYLIVLDDMDRSSWEWIESTFKDNGKSSRIIVITSMLPVSNLCNRGDGYEYQVKTIGDKGSKKISLLDQQTANDYSETLLNKCNGLPLALVSVADHFSSIRGSRTDQCKALCNDLGSFLHDAQRDKYGNFGRLRGVLMDSYAGLPNCTVRRCLLYLGIFPDGSRIKKNKITRRWVAEGYALSHAQLSAHQVADANFQDFIDRCIIQPVGISSSRTCKALGIVHEFVMHKSISQNFSMAFPCPQQETTTGSKKNKKVRHIFVNGSNGTSSGNLDLSCVRSLTVSKRAGLGSAFSKFSKYKLMRVLDLEECSDVYNSHLKDICKLWNLRYLSLGPKITKLPEQIAQLELLESLHLSKEKVSELPVQVIGMPCLVHLIGKFKILYRKEREKDAIDLSKNSNLQTLAGFVADGEQGFLLLMPHMKKLRKVKIWCGSNGDIKTLDTQLLQAIQNYTEDEKNRSLTIDFKGLTQGDLEKLHNKGSHDNNYQFFKERYNIKYLNSLKLHGILSTIPQFVAILPDITKLCLSLTTVTQNLLSSLSGINPLVHLKLIAGDIAGNLVIKVGEFQKLESLCFEVSGSSAADLNIEVKCSSNPETEETTFALPNLVSLQLLCERLAGLSGIEITYLKKLQEIELHHDVMVNAREEWEVAAQKHPNRPNVLPFVSVDDPENPDAGATTEESAHDHVVTQEQLADDGPRPNVQGLSTSPWSRLKSLLAFMNPPQSPQRKHQAPMTDVQKQFNV